MRPTLFGTLTSTGTPTLPAMDGIWSLRLSNPDYTGYAVRAGLAADSGATTLDIGFNADGSFDMDAYEGFGTGSERIVTWYDQSGNGYNLTRAWSATLCPIVRTSTYNNQPCIYFATGSIGNAGFNPWGGLADANVFVAKRQTQIYNAYTFANAAGSGYIYTGESNRRVYWGLISSVDSQYYNTANSAGTVWRCQFDGAGATNALKARLYLNGTEETRDTGNGSWGATFPSAAGFYLNGDSAGNNAQLLCEYWAVYYNGTDMSTDDVAATYDYLNYYFFALEDSQIFCCGDSLTLNSANGGPSDPDAYPNLLDVSLSATTGTAWLLRDVSLTAEAGAQTERVLQMMEANGATLDSIDTHYSNHVVVAWAGTNDLAAGDSAATALTGSLNITTPASERGATVYYLNMLPRKDLGGGNAAFEASRTTYNADLATTLGATATVVDVATLLPDCEDLTYYLSDKVHLNDAGNAVVANAVAEAIEANL